jgi:hypothetical protein
MYQFKAPSDNLQRTFLLSLARDLQMLGHKAKYKKIQEKYHELRVTPFDSSQLTADELGQLYKELYGNLKRRIWKRNREFILKIEKEIEETYLVDAELIDVNSISRLFRT